LVLGSDARDQEVFHHSEVFFLEGFYGTSVLDEMDSNSVSLKLSLFTNHHGNVNPLVFFLVKELFHLKKTY